MARLVGFAVEAEELFAIGFVGNNSLCSAVLEPLAQFGAVVGFVGEELFCRFRRIKRFDSGQSWSWQPVQKDKRMDISVLGIDLDKNSCSIVGLDLSGKVLIRRRMRRETVIAFCSKLPACIVVMEACCSVHHMGRALAAKGHIIRLMSPEYVRP